MQTEAFETETAVTLAVELCKDKLLGFRHVEAETGEACFAEEAAATFNKIGETVTGNTLAD